MKLASNAKGQAMAEYAILVFTVLFFLGWVFMPLNGEGFLEKFKQYYQKMAIQLSKSF
jgi:hypothetical protein